MAVTNRALLAQRRDLRRERDALMSAFLRCPKGQFIAGAQHRLRIRLHGVEARLKARGIS